MTKNEKQKERRKNNNNEDTKKYEKTKKGFLMRLYRNMQSRVTGVQKSKFHLYQGKTLLGRKEFYDWALTSLEFHEMFFRWEESGYSRKLTPTVDRVNSKNGYLIENMRWLTHSENSRLGSIACQKIHVKNGRRVRSVFS